MPWFEACWAPYVCAAMRPLQHQASRPPASLSVSSLTDARRVPIAVVINDCAYASSLPPHLLGGLLEDRGDATLLVLVGVTLFEQCGLELKPGLIQRERHPAPPPPSDQRSFRAGVVFLTFLRKGLAHVGHFFGDPFELGEDRIRGALVFVEMLAT